MIGKMIKKMIEKLIKKCQKIEKKNVRKIKFSQKNGKKLKNERFLIVKKRKKKATNRISAS
jgi:hypothetical protein